MDKEKLIQKWLLDKLTPEETKVFESFEDVIFLKAIVANANSFRASNFLKPNTYEAFKKDLATNKTPVKRLNWVRPLMRIASVFIIGFAVYYFFFYESLTQMETHFGQKITLTLPDESVVSLNAMSSVVYNEKDWPSNRTIKLEGEAFFDVAKGKQFTVNTPKGEIAVLGTEFNIKQRDDFFEVKCFEGTVRVSVENQEIILKQGDNMRWFKQRIEQGKNTYSLPQWTRNISSFQRVTLNQVFSELERQFSIAVILNNVDGDRLFTGGFEHDNLNNALKSVTIPLNLSYVVLENKKVRIQPQKL